MSRKTTIIAAVLVLLFGVTAIAISRMGKGDSDETTADKAPNSSTTDDSGRRFNADANEADERTARRSQREIRNEELVDQYGEARTNLARHVSENVTGLLDDAISMGDMMIKGEGFGGRGDWALRGALRNTGVELTEEQQEKASTLYKEFQKRELDKTKNAVAQLRNDPTTLMSMVLAGDAHSRGDIDETAYGQLQTANAEALGDIINPLDRNNFRGGQPMEDEAFRSGFEAILDADQTETFNTKMAENEGEDEGPAQTDITQMPVMDLETLDQQVGAAKQMTSGFRQVMEGMGGLRDFQPKVEPKTE